MLMGSLFVLGAVMYGTSYAFSSYVIVEPEFLQSNLTPTIGYYAHATEPTPLSNPDGEAAPVAPTAVQESMESLENIVLLPVVGDHKNPDQNGETGLVHAIDVDELIQAQESDNLPADGDVPILPTSTPTPLPTSTPLPLITQEILENEAAVVSTPEGEEPETSLGNEKEEESPTPEPPQSDPSQPVVRLKIPRIKVERAVVEIGAHPEKGWDTDSLYATKNRPDLVGHLAGSALPGEGSNIVLAGHNYDWGIFQWNGVFYNLRRLKPGDKIFAFTQGGERHTYFVHKVKEIPFKNGNEEELFKHAKHLGPTETERLTLVTCSGANLLNWNKRVYVIAFPDAGE
jgi:LPXTG-site transpeptidase (sortase) family protein